MTGIKMQQQVSYSTDSAAIHDAAYKEITLRSKRPDSWRAAQVLFVYISDAAKRDQELEATKHDLFQLASRSSCGVSLYNAVVAMLKDIKDAWDDAGQHARYNRHAEYDVRSNDYSTNKKEFEKWIRRWGIQTSFVKHMPGPCGGAICSMATVITPRDDTVMATLQPYRTPSTPERRSSSVSQTSAAGHERRKGSAVSTRSNRRGSEGGVFL